MYETLLSDSTSKFNFVSPLKALLLIVSKLVREIDKATKPSNKVNELSFNSAISW